MKLVRFGDAGFEKPGVLDAEGRPRDLSSHLADITGQALMPAGIAKLKSIDLNTLPLVAGNPRLGPCVAQVGKIVCIGLNYSDHAAEAFMKIPPEPIIFMKATSAITGPNDPLEMPRDARSMDWEGELGVVIGLRAKYVAEEQAMEHVAGYCIVNDVSERSFQMERQGQWTKGKSHDTFAPIGPWMVTADEIADPQALAIQLDVNDHRYQSGSTATMVYQVRFLVSYLSRFMTLNPGDIIATGTPPGVGMGQKPPVYLKPGDRITLTIEGLGVQQQTVIAQ